MRIFRANLYQRPVTTGWNPEPVYILVKTYVLRKYV